MKYDCLVGKKIVADRNVSDLKIRTWKERLFTLPWKPLKKYKKVPVAYVVNFFEEEVILVSYETYGLLKNVNILDYGSDDLNDLRVEVK